MHSPGGGSLVTFPALLFAGLNPIDANASSVVALFPATFSTVWAYRRSIVKITEIDVRSFLVVSLIGGLLGDPASAVDADRHLRWGWFCSRRSCSRSAISRRSP